MSRNLEIVAEVSRNLKRSAGLSRREDSEEGERPGKSGKGTAMWDAQARGRQKIIEILRTEIRS